MTRNHPTPIKTMAVATLGALLICPPTYAQTGSGTTSTITRASLVQELKILEQNGYNPGGDDIHYPTDIQRAQKKALGQPVSRDPNLP
jgi:Domain of unknown function (DUF4148)